MGSSYKIAHFSDTHLGYSARCRSNEKGVNIRLFDGLKGLKATVSDILEEEVDAVVHGGDLFHRSAPGVGEIAVARRQLERFAAAGIPFMGATGNHDFATDRGKSPATAAVHDPDRNIHMVTGSVQTFSPIDGLNIQVVSHAGLIGINRATPQPIEGETSILVTHGAAQVPGSEVFTCVDSPGEAVIGFDILNQDWAVSLLGHYHKRGPLPSFSDGKTGQAWYAGSLLRRGFSDPPGGRGWLLVEVDTDGSVTITPRNVAQREQHDLPTIDASNMTGPDVEEQIRHNLDQIDLSKEPIIRQRVINCPVSVRRGVDTHSLKKLTENALVWQLEFFRPPMMEIIIEEGDQQESSNSLSTASGADLTTSWGQWFPEYAEHNSMPQHVRERVQISGEKLLKKVSEDVETITLAEQVEEIEGRTTS